ncbi:MAG: hypothetical protein ACOC46_01905, partial [Pirellulales bacterium]
MMSLLRYGLHIAVLSAFAFVQPLFNLLSRNAEFFVARRMGTADVLLFVILAGLVLPVLLAAPVVLIGMVSLRAARVVLHVAAGALAACIALLAIKSLLPAAGGVVVACGIGIGVAFTLAYWRFRRIGTLLTMLAPAIVIFPTVFLVGSPVGRLAFSRNASAQGGVAVPSTTPVVLVVFDEFPTMSLMNGDRGIDAARYPHFAALAGEAYWFRNATTVAPGTEHAVPAILTGCVPDYELLPTLADHPRNLFTLLQGHHDLVVVEDVTHLCPETDPQLRNRRPPLRRRFSLLTADLSVAFLHLLLPRDWTEGLPQVNRTWGDFWGLGRNEPAGQAATPADSSNDDKIAWLRRSGGRRPRKVVEFLDAIGPTDKPTLYFLHCFLPHAPWVYLPSGKQYCNPREYWTIRSLQDEKWGPDPWAPIESFQRHLLQVGFVDRILGAIVARLKQTGIYDRAL